MSENTAEHSPRYLFTTSAPELKDDVLHVVRFRGEEGLNTLFSFTVELVCSNPALDTGALLQAPACLSINRENGAPATFAGYPARVEQGGEFHGWTYYTVELRPPLWKCTQIRQSAIFLDKNLQDTLEELLSSQQFFPFARKFKLMDKEYPVPEFAMQHNESLYDYMCWRLEEQGAYFFFEPAGGAVVFADHPRSHTALGSTPELTYSPVTNLEGRHVPEVVIAFRLTQTPLPRRVVIRSYDWKKPDTIVLGTADVKNNGLGDVYLAHEAVTTAKEADRLAKLRAEELICQSRQFHGESAAPEMRPGYTFTLKEHPAAPFNRDYLLTSVTHEGSQETFLSMALGIPMHGAQDHLFYRNSFTCIESDTPYRPARTAPRAKVEGIIRAFIDAAGSGARAEMDEYGRYKVLFPFDISGRKEGKASCWIRMAQPHLGKDSGMSFPLRNGTEVTITFEEGNPDLPVITGALANGEVPAQTKQGTENFTGLRTAGGNQLAFNDTDTHQGISLSTANGAGLRVSSGSDDWASTSAGTLTQISGSANALATTMNSAIAGLRSSTTVGSIAHSGLLLMKSVDAMVTSLGKSYSSSTNENWQTAGKGVKLGAVVLDSIVQGWANVKALQGDTAMPFGAVLSADANGAQSHLRVLSSLQEILTLEILSVVGRLGEAAFADGAIGVKETEEKEEKDPLAYIASLNDVLTMLQQLNTSYGQKFAVNIQRYTVLDCGAASVLNAEIKNAITFLNGCENKANSSIVSLNNKIKVMDDAHKICCGNSQDTVKDDDKNKYINSLNDILNEFEAIDKNYSTDFSKNIAKYSEAKCDAAATVKAAASNVIIFLTQKKSISLQTTLLKNKQIAMNAAWEKCCSSYQENNTTKYEAKAKHPPVLGYLVSSTQSLIPELVAKVILFCSTIKLNKNNSKFGGILLNAPDANVNISANTTVSTHAQQGVLTCTVSEPDVYGASPAVGYENVPKGRMQWGAGNDGAQTPPDCVTKTPFIKINADELSKGCGAEMSYDGNDVFDRDAGNANGPLFTYIADRTGLRYTSADQIVERANTDHVSEALRHVLFTPKNRLTLREARPQGNSFDGTRQDEPGISLIANLAANSADIVDATARGYETTVTAWEGAKGRTDTAKQALDACHLKDGAEKVAYAAAKIAEKGAYDAMLAAKTTLLEAVRAAYNPDNHHISLLVQGAANDPGTSVRAGTPYTSLILKKASAQLAYGKDANTPALQENRVTLKLEEKQGAFTAGDDSAANNGGASLNVHQGVSAELKYAGTQISKVTVGNNKITLDPGDGGNITLCNITVEDGDIQAKSGDLSVNAQGKIKLG